MDFTLRNTSEYQKISLEETIKFLETTTDGLSESEVNKRLKIFGYNEIVEKKIILFVNSCCAIGVLCRGCWSLRWGFHSH